MTRDLNEEICHCMGVTVGDIKKAVEDGAVTFEEVQEVTQAATGCGGCESEVRELVKEFSHK